MIPQLDLPPPHLALVRGILAKYLPNAEVWAYGSRVNGSSHSSSDLDLVVRQLQQTSLDRPPVQRLQNAFDESDLPISVDVLDWTRMPDNFRREVEREHVIVQEICVDST